MSKPIQLGIHGSSGRMGKQLLHLVNCDERFHIAARLDSHSDLHKLPALDVMIDFSSPEGLGRILEVCRKQGTALVSGTTGLNHQVERALQEAGANIAVLHAANFSLGVAVLTRLLGEAARLLPDWDLEITEAHHAAKRDAPSGTALALGKTAAQARGVSLGAVQLAGRQGMSDGRPRGQIGFASIRAGDIVGEHNALLVGQGERIELGHRAGDRSIFARGALTAAAWLALQPAGFHTLTDVLNGADGQVQ